MKIYAFWSADTTYFTKSKSLKNAQAIGKENMKFHIATCEYLGEQSKVEESYFIPESVEEISKEWFNHLIKTDSDTLILDDELYTCIKDK